MRKKGTHKSAKAAVMQRQFRARVVPNKVGKRSYKRSVKHKHQDTE